MTNDLNSNRSIPSAAVIPVLRYESVEEAAEWLSLAFGFRVRLRIGSHRIQMTWMDGAIVVADGGSAAKSSGLREMLVRIADADAHHARAASAGARIVSPPETQVYGERQYSCVDIGGHSWTFSETVSDVNPADWGGELC